MLKAATEYCLQDFRTKVLGLHRRPQRLDCAQPSADQFFFAAGALGAGKEDVVADRSRRARYSEQLRAMSEPSLSCQQPPGEVYRFLWLRTWGAPVAVRVERTADVGTLSAVELDGSGGYHPGQVARNVQRALTFSEWTAIKQALSGAAFWTMPSRFTEQTRDGARWIVEGRSGARYHLTDRWSPETGAYRELCLLLLRLAGLMPEGDGKRYGVY